MAESHLDGLAELDSESIKKMIEKIKNTNYSTMQELATDYMILNMEVDDYYRSKIAPMLQNFLDKTPTNFPEYTEDTFKWQLEEPKSESND